MVQVIAAFVSSAAAQDAEAATARFGRTPPILPTRTERTSATNVMPMNGRIFMVSPLALVMGTAFAQRRNDSFRESALARNTLRLWLRGCATVFGAARALRERTEAAFSAHTGRTARQSDA